MRVKQTGRESNVFRVARVPVWHGSGCVGAAVLQTRHTTTSASSLDLPFFLTLISVEKQQKKENTHELIRAKPATREQVLVATG